MTAAPAPVDPATAGRAEVDRELLVDRLHAERPQAPRERVAWAVDRAMADLADARVGAYLPILVERRARRTLADEVG